MKKYILSIGVLFLFVFINYSSAQAGKVTPFKWYKGVDIIDLVDACPIEDIDPAQPKPTISNMTGSFRVIRTDGSEQFYDNRHGEAKAPMELKDGDQINTSDGSSSINFSDGSSWVLDNNTTIKYRNAETLTKVSLLIGKLRILKPTVFLQSTKNKISAKLETKMKVAAACVRGTDFVMEQTEDENTSKYYLYEGTLDIASLNGEIKHLQPGDIAVVNADSQVVLTKLDDTSWNKLIEPLTPVGAIKPPTPEGEKAGEQFSIKWIILIIVLLGIAGYYIYRKKSR